MVLETSGESDNKNECIAPGIWMVLETSGIKSDAISMRGDGKKLFRMRVIDNYEL